MRALRKGTSSAVTIVVNASLAALTAAASSGALAQAPRTSPLACADMKSAGKTVEYLEFPDEGHRPRKMKNKIKEIETVIAWLDRFLPDLTS